MFDASVRGWILLLAGAALSIYAYRRDRSRRGDSWGSLEGWGARLIGMGLMVQGGAFHFEHLGITDFAWLHWAALGVMAVGTALVLVGRLPDRAA